MTRYRHRSRAVLTESDARGVRLYAAVLTGSVRAKAQHLAREGCWGVTWRAIYDVLRGETWVDA